MVANYLAFMVANYPIHGSTYQLTHTAQSLLGNENLWSCVEWSKGLLRQFNNMDLKYWEVDEFNILGFHSTVRARFGTQTIFFDPWVHAALIYQFIDPFPGLPHP